VVLKTRQLGLAYRTLVAVCSSERFIRFNNDITFDDTNGLSRHNIAISPSILIETHLVHSFRTLA